MKPILGPSDSIAFLLSLAGSITFGYAVYYTSFSSNMSAMHQLLPSRLRPYGHLKFLTHQNLLIQLVSVLLHLLAFFTSSVGHLRDLVFCSLAFPIGCTVCCSFWGVWHVFGRELIFPVAIGQYYPAWLNHVTHTLIAPLNVALALLVPHRYQQHGFALTCAYIVGYFVFLHFLKFTTGHFVYKYLDVMGEVERIVYFGGTALLAYALYRSGEFIAHLQHHHLEPPQRSHHQPTTAPLAAPTSPATSTGGPSSSSCDTTNDATTR